MNTISKHKSIIRSFAQLLSMMAITISLGSCSDDFLERTPEDSYTEDNFYATDEALEAATSPLYTKAWFDYNGGPMMYIGSMRANDAFTPWGEPEWTVFQVSALHSNLVAAWRDFYGVITMANATINGITNKCSGTVTEAGKASAIAEARLMRAVAYFYMVRLWGPVILFEDNQEVIDHPVRALNTESDVFKFIINDLTYAAENLPESGTKGRVTKWSAEALLAKVYLARSGWNGGQRNADDLAQARSYALDVCENSGLSLLANYEDLFKYKYNNNEESLIAMQWVPLGEWGVCNTLYSSLTISDISGGVACWGSPEASYEQIQQYEDDDTLRLNATFMTQGTYYSYLNISDGGYTYDSETAKVKKGAVGGPDDDNDGYVAAMNSPLNTYILRLADTYLTLAEACLGNSAELYTGEGLVYFNMVRQRAGLQPKTSITFEDIMRERRCEFGMEYCNWYDMVSWFKWKPDYMLSFFNNQNRGIRAIVKRDESGKRVLTKDKEEPDYVININKDNIFLPYPESDVVQNPLLKEDPQPYDFGE